MPIFNNRLHNFHWGQGRGGLRQLSLVLDICYYVVIVVLVNI